MGRAKMLTGFEQTTGSDMDDLPSTGLKKRKGSFAIFSAADKEEGSNRKKAKPAEKKDTAFAPVKARVRSSPFCKVAEGRPIPRSYEECSEADRQLIDLRDAGLTWPEVRRRHAEFTGQVQSATSTLPNRYSRLISNFTNIRSEDQPILLKAKLEVDDRFEKERWRQVSMAMMAKGTQKYQPEVLQRQYKKLMARAEVLVNSASGATIIASDGDDDADEDEIYEAEQALDA